VGALVRELWSVAGPDGRHDVNQFLIQPFVNYNLAEGWSVGTGPVITANWSASGEKWSVPIGGGVSKIFAIDGQPMSASLQIYDYVVHATGGPEWALRFSVSFLFPKWRRAAARGSSSATVRHGA